MLLLPQSAKSPNFLYSTILYKLECKRYNSGFKSKITFKTQFLLLNFEIFSRGKAPGPSGLLGGILYPPDPGRLTLSEIVKFHPQNLLWIIGTFFNP